MPTDRKYSVDKVLHNYHLQISKTTFLFTVITKLLALASQVAETNPAAAQLIVNLNLAETSSEIIEFLHAYDNAVAETVS